jgi:eukaryotic-like serine/threonine-protein kinase
MEDNGVLKISAYGGGTSMMLGRIGDVIVGRYRLDRPVGGAVGGDVWQAFDVRLARPVAVRVTPVDPGDADAADTAGQRLVAAMAQLNHPGIAAIYDVGVTEDYAYTVSEWTEGRTLAQIMATGPQRWQRVADWGQQIGAALAALHAGGIAHGSLNPESIVVHDDRQLKVLDAGIATLAQAGPLDDDTHLIGTRNRSRRVDDDTHMLRATRDEPGTYPGAGGGSANDATRLLGGGAGPDADPTRVLGADPGSGGSARNPALARAQDVWALGALSWQAVLGPNEPTPQAGLAPDPRELQEEAAVPGGFADLTVRLLAPEPTARPTAVQASDGFAALLAGERQSAAPVILPVDATRREAAGFVPAPTPAEERYRPREQPAARGGRRGLVAGLVALVAAAGVGLGLYFAESGSGTQAPTTQVTSPPTNGAAATGSTVTLPDNSGTATPSVTGTAPTASPSASASSTPSKSPTPSSSPSASASPSQTTTTTPPTSGSTPTDGGSPTATGGNGGNPPPTTPTEGGQ